MMSSQKSDSHSLCYQLWRFFPQAPVKHETMQDLAERHVKKLQQMREDLETDGKLKKETVLALEAQIADTILQAQQRSVEAKVKIPISD